MSDFYEDPVDGIIGRERLEDCKEIIGVWIAPNSISKRKLVVWKNRFGERMGWYVDPTQKTFKGWNVLDRPSVMTMIDSEPPIWTPRYKISVEKSVGCQCTAYDLTWLGHNNGCPEKKRR